MTFLLKPPLFSIWSLLIRNTVHKYIFFKYVWLLNQQNLSRNNLNDALQLQDK